jgi:hypothetical protein
MPKQGATHRIVDINVAKELEVSWVRRGSNDKAKVFLKKSADEHQPETTDMKLSLLKSVALAALMAHPTTAAFVSTTFTKEEDIDAFLKKDEATRDAEIGTFAKAKNMPMPDDDADDATASDGKKVKKAELEAYEAELKKAADLKKAAGGGDEDDKIAAAVTKALESSPVFAELKKENETLKGTIEKMSSGVVVATLEKRAETEFAGIGLKKEQTMALLKAQVGLDDDAKGALEALMKAHVELVRKVGTTSLGLEKISKDEGSASSRLQKMAIEKATTDKISLEKALVMVCEDPQNAELVAESDAEVDGVYDRAA